MGGSPGVMFVADLEPVLSVTLCSGIEFQVALEFKIFTWPYRVIMKIYYQGGKIKYILLSVYYLDL